MAEDWRLTVALQGDESVGRLLNALQAHQVEETARDRFGERVAVSRGPDCVFLYADSEAVARAVAQEVQGLVTADALTADFRLDRWHPEAESWEDAAVPLPATAAEWQAEHERRERQETADSASSGLAAWEVRIELPSHADAQALGEQLEQEGFDVVRRWTFLVVGASDEDDARELAARLQANSPPGSEVHVEPGGGFAWQLVGSNPFAVFGGLAG